MGNANRPFGEEEESDWIKENKVRAVIWNKSWIPLIKFEVNKRIAIDLNPGKNGNHGQIIQIWGGHDLETDNVVIASPFEDFSEVIVKRLKEKIMNIRTEQLHLLIIGTYDFNCR